MTGEPVDQSAGDTPEPAHKRLSRLTLGTMIVVTILVLVFLNAPAMRQTHVDASPYLAHGWPCTYLERDIFGDGLVPAADAWKFWKDVERVSPPLLALNVLVGILIGGSVVLLLARLHRTRWQVTLSEGLILVAVVAALAATDRHWHRRTVRQATAVGAGGPRNTALGPTYIRWEPQGIYWLNCLISSGPVPRWGSIYLLTLEQTQTDALGRAVPELPRLTFLSIGHGALSSQDLDSLSSLPQLDQLSLTNCGLKDEDLEALGSLPLKTLDLSGNDITDDGLAHLHGMTSLRDLSLSNTQITDEGVDEIRAVLPELQVWDD